MPGVSSPGNLGPRRGVRYYPAMDKAIVFGSSRLVTSNLGYEAYHSEYYQDDSDDIYETVDEEDSRSGKNETNVYLNKETWEANFYYSLNFNLLLTTWGDMYQHSCQNNTETYDLMLSPFRFDHFYKDWMFWMPFGFLVANYLFFYENSQEESNSQVNYYLRRGLKESDLRRDSFPKYYMVGVGEEMFFRGTVQNYFFESLKDRWGFSASSSRHLSIFGASAVFAAAHDGPVLRQILFMPLPLAYTKDTSIIVPWIPSTS